MNYNINYALANWRDGNYHGSSTKSIDEFYADFTLFNNVRRWINRYVNGRVCKTRVMINQMVILINQFEFECVEGILKGMVDPDRHIYVNTIFAFLLSRDEYAGSIHDAFMAELKKLLTNPK